MHNLYANKVALAKRLTWVFATSRQKTLRFRVSKDLSHYFVRWGSEKEEE